jgi:hypothetical protein
LGLGLGLRAVVSLSKVVWGAAAGAAQETAEELSSVAADEPTSLVM